MDELDLLIDGLDSEGALTTIGGGEELDPDVLIALEEFQSESNPRNKVEALKLLLKLVNQ